MKNKSLSDDLFYTIAGNKHALFSRNKPHFYKDEIKHWEKYFNDNQEEIPDIISRTRKL